MNFCYVDGSEVNGTVLQWQVYLLLLLCIKHYHKILHKKGATWLFSPQDSTMCPSSMARNSRVKPCFEEWRQAYINGGWPHTRNIMLHRCEKKESKGLNIPANNSRFIACNKFSVRVLFLIIILVLTLAWFIIRFNNALNVW